MKPSLDLLKKLATCADTEDAAPDLRAHLLAHANVYTGLLGAPSAAHFAAAITSVTDATLAKRVLSTIADANKDAKIRTAREGELARAAAAETVAARIARSFLTWRLDREALLAALDGLSHDARLCFVPAHGPLCSVPAYLVQKLLKLRKDARPFLYPQSPRDPFVIHWGARGRMTFASDEACLSWRDVMVHLPMIERLDGARVELVQAAE